MDSKPAGDQQQHEGSSMHVCYGAGAACGQQLREGSSMCVIVQVHHPSSMCTLPSRVQPDPPETGDR